MYRHLQLTKKCRFYKKKIQLITINNNINNLQNILCLFSHTSFSIYIRLNIYIT